MLFPHCVIIANDLKVRESPSWHIATHFHLHRQLFSLRYVACHVREEDANIIFSVGNILPTEDDCLYYYNFHHHLSSLTTRNKQSGI